MIYDTREYAESRLLNTIVLHKRTPVKVRRISRGMVATVINPSNRNSKEYLVPCDELNLLDLSLGFLNKDGQARFLARRTLRRDWRQGLRPGNVSMGREGSASYRDIANALLHRYPSFSEATERTGPICVSVAWCEDFAIHRSGKIIWRYDNVGSFDGEKIHLLPKFGFLSGALKENTNGSYEVVSTT